MSEKEWPCWGVRCSYWDRLSFESGRMLPEPSSMVREFVRTDLLSLASIAIIMMVYDLIISKSISPTRIGFEGRDFQG